MLTPIIDQTIPTAPRMARPRFLFQVQLGATPADVTGENRLAFGPDVANGFVITGCDAHAAVRMHASPANGTSWSTYDPKGKTVATIPSAGKLRPS